MPKMLDYMGNPGNAGIMLDCFITDELCAFAIICNKEDPEKVAEVIQKQKNINDIFRIDFSGENGNIDEQLASFNDTVGL